MFLLLVTPLVAYYVEGRSQEQCKRRWQLLNHVDQKKGRWTLEEDEVLGPFYNSSYLSQVSFHKVYSCLRK